MCFAEEVILADDENKNDYDGMELLFFFFSSNPLNSTNQDTGQCNNVKVEMFFSVPGSHRRATKNHKSKAELLNPEEGEGDLALGTMLHSHTHSLTKTNHRHTQMLSYLAFQHYLTIVSFLPLPFFFFFLVFTSVFSQIFFFLTGNVSFFS